MGYIHAIILAAGKGTRMNSAKPKVLQVLSSNTLLDFVLAQAKAVCNKIHIVYGFGSSQIRAKINDPNVNWVVQAEQLGTGHAVQQAMAYIEDNSISLILYGDVPLIKESTLNRLIVQAKKNTIALLSVVLADPTGYGRIIRQENKIKAIIEQKDANAKQLAICEVNTGIMAIDSALLKKYLNNLDTNNAQGELYLTSIIAMAAKDGINIASVIAKNESEVAGVNDKVQLAKLERIVQQDQAKKLMQEGLTLKDPSRFDCRGNLSCGQDCEIDINVVIEGKVFLGNNVTIAANCLLKNTEIADNVTIMANSIIENSIISSGASIGPFVHIRPKTQIGKNTKIGNFVEIKKSIIGDYSKISHLSYIGDTVMGKKVNIGAGVITCNYDGINKHQTLIEDGAFVGSNTQLVAPIKIGKNAVIGAGSTIVKDAPENKLTLSRSKQTSLRSWNKLVK